MPTTAPFRRIDPLVTALEQLARVQREAATQVARDLGCSRMTISVLRALDAGPRQLTDIASTLRVDLSVASRHASHLVDAGLAARSVDPTDRRARTITVTDTGQELLQRSCAQLVQLAEQSFAAWSDEDLATGAATVARLAEAITPSAPGAAPSGPPTSQPASPHSG